MISLKALSGTDGDRPVFSVGRLITLSPPCPEATS